MPHTHFVLCGTSARRYFVLLVLAGIGDCRRALAVVAPDHIGAELMHHAHWLSDGLPVAGTSPGWPITRHLGRKDCTEADVCEAY